MLETTWQRIQPGLTQLHQRLISMLQHLRPFVIAARLDQHVDLLLLLLPVLWTASLSQEAIHYGVLCAMLLAVTAIRCATWLYNDLQDAKQNAQAPDSFLTVGLITARQGWRLSLGLLGFAALMLSFIGGEALLTGVAAVLLLLLYPHLKRRTLLTEAYLGISLAWVVVMAHSVSPGISTKALWLLYTATWLWSTAYTLLYAMPRRHYAREAGIGSLTHLFGDNIGPLTITLQLIAVIALWFVSEQSALGETFADALLLAMALLTYQQWLLSRHPDIGTTLAYRNNLAFGIVIMLGLVGEQL